MNILIIVLLLIIAISFIVQYTVVRKTNKDIKDIVNERDELYKRFKDYKDKQDAKKVSIQRIEIKDDIEVTIKTDKSRKYLKMMDVVYRVNTDPCHFPTFFEGKVRMDYTENILLIEQRCYIDYLINKSCYPKAILLGGISNIVADKIKDKDNPKYSTDEIYDIYRNNKDVQKAINGIIKKFKGSKN